MRQKKKGSGTSKAKGRNGTTPLDRGKTLKMGGVEKFPGHRNKNSKSSQGPNTKWSHLGKGDI